MVRSYRAPVRTAVIEQDRLTSWYPLIAGTGAAVPGGAGAVGTGPAGPAGPADSAATATSAMARSRVGSASATLLWPRTVGAPCRAA
jgi:hypothetical protein